MKLYYFPGSPVSRGTLLTLKALNLEVETQKINTVIGEQFDPAYLKLNPLHTVPTLVDEDFVLWDSHAINCYLVDKYGQNDKLYPKDLQKRAVVHQRLHFHSGVLFPRVGIILYSLIKTGARSLNKDQVDMLVMAYASLETLLEGKKYVAGDEMTIADFSLVATVTSGNVLVPIASNRYPFITEWLGRMQKLSYYAEANQKGLDELAGFVKSKLA